MTKPTLVILAAGMASRYGSMKQTEGFGPNGETIMDYSIYDAIAAGFGKIIFIIRQDFATTFEAIFNKKLHTKVAVTYVYQQLNAYTQSITVPADRTKPWGTGHAMLCALNAIQEPFAVINADDFYGKNAFEMASDFLQHSCTPNTYAIVGYELKKTLSLNGTVSRGVCTVAANGNLTAVTERTKVLLQNGTIMYDDNGSMHTIENDARASMNFWLFHPTVMPIAKMLFEAFLQTPDLNLKAEFYLTNIGDYVIKNNIATIQVIPTNAQWFGVTYKEDASIVAAEVEALIATNVYPNNLWNV